MPSAAVPAERCRAGTGADDAERQRVEGGHDHRSVDDQAVIDEALEHLGQERHDRRADQRAGERSGTAEDHHGQKEDRGLELECFGADEALEEGEQMPAGARQRRR